MKTTKFKRRLAVSILKSTTTYKLKHIAFNVDDIDIKVWNTSSVHGNFNPTQIIPLFTSCFSTFLQYNDTEKRVELVIF